MKAMKYSFLVLALFVSACASNRFSFRRTVPSQFNIQDIKKIAVTPLTPHSLVDAVSANDVTKRVEEKLRASGLFQVMTVLSARDVVEASAADFDAYLVGDIHQYNVTQTTNTRREERDVTTDQGTQKQTVIVPTVHKVANIDYTIELIRSKDRRILGTKNYSENSDATSDGDSIRYMSSDESIKNDLLNKTLTRLTEDFIPHDVSYSVPWVKNDDINAGVELGKQGRWPEARQAWEDILKNNPNHDAALYMIGVSYEAQGQYSQAKVKYDAAYQIRQDRLYQEASLRAGNYKQDKEKLDLEMAGR